MRQLGTWVGQRVGEAAEVWRGMRGGCLPLRLRRRRGAQGTGAGAARQGVRRVGRHRCGWARARGKQGLGCRTLGQAGRRGRVYKCRRSAEVLPFNVL